MDEQSVMPPNAVDALRIQIRSDLEREARERRTRHWLTAAGALLGISLLMNVLVMVAPGAVGLASSADVDEVGAAVAAEARAREAGAAATVAEARAAARQAVSAAPVLTAVPGICATISELGDWSFASGEAPARECPTAP
jgi:hypothetical protein